MTEPGTDQTSRITFEGRTLTVVQRRVSPAITESWTFTDAAGHVHTYGSPDDPYPTLIRVSDGWAEPSENPDDNSDVERYHLACQQCGETIWPTPSGPGSEFLPEIFFYWIDDEQVTRKAAREFTNRLRVADPGKWDRLYGWLKYSAGLIPRRSMSGGLSR